MNNKQKQLRESIRRAIRNSLLENVDLGEEEALASLRVPEEERVFASDLDIEPPESLEVDASDVEVLEASPEERFGNRPEDYRGTTSQDVTFQTSPFGHRAHMTSKHHQGTDTVIVPHGQTRLAADYAGGELGGGQLDYTPDYTEVWNRYRDEEWAPARTQLAIQAHKEQHGDTGLTDEQYVEQGLIPDYYEQEYDEQWISDNPYGELFSEDEISNMERSERRSNMVSRMLTDRANRIIAPANMEIISVCGGAAWEPGGSNPKRISAGSQKRYSGGQCTAPVRSSGNRVVARFYDNETEKWYFTAFNHLEEMPDVKVGDRIEAGSYIGGERPAVISSTGYSKGDHLHHVMWEQPEGFELGDDFGHEYGFKTQNDNLLRNWKAGGALILDADGQPQVDPDMVEIATRPGNYAERGLMDWNDFLLTRQGGLGEAIYSGLEEYPDHEFRRGPNGSWYYINTMEMPEDYSFFKKYPGAWQRADADTAAMLTDRWPTREQMWARNPIQGQAIQGGLSQEQADEIELQTWLRSPSMAGMSQQQADEISALIGQDRAQAQARMQAIEDELAQLSPRERRRLQRSAGQRTAGRSERPRRGRAIGLEESQIRRFKILAVIRR